MSFEPNSIVSYLRKLINYHTDDFVPFKISNETTIVVCNPHSRTSPKEGRLGQQSLVTNSRVGKQTQSSLFLPKFRSPLSKARSKPYKGLADESKNEPNRKDGSVQRLLDLHWAFGSTWGWAEPGSPGWSIVLLGPLGAGLSLLLLDGPLCLEWIRFLRENRIQ